MKKQKFPDNDRQVLTFVQDDRGLKAWQFDCYSHGRWIEATAWGCNVLHWQELPPDPDIEDLG